MRAGLLALALAALPGLLVSGVLSGASAQGRGIVLQAQPPPPALPGGRPVAPAAPPSVFEPAPTPNRDFEAPLGPRAGNTPAVEPGFFTRKDQYRGDGFSRGSTSETEVERRVKPGAGFNLRLPLQPN